MQKVIERMLNLLAFLLTVERPVTADEIRHTVAGYDHDSDEAFRRMFERDKDLLRSLGIPLELRPTDAWEVEFGYVVPADQYALPDPGLTDEERASLWLAAQVVSIGGLGRGPDALFKLGGAPLAGGGEPLGANLGEGPELADAFVAVAERRLVEFTYKDVERRLRPYGLVHRRGHWYVVGAEVGGETVKAFRLDRMVGLEATGDPGAFERPPDFSASEAIPAMPWEAGEDDMEAVVVFDSDIAWWARRQVGASATIDERADGSLEARLRVAHPDAFLGWLVAFEDHAELMEPDTLRRRYVELVRP